MLERLHFILGVCVGKGSQLLLLFVNKLVLYTASY